MGSYIRYSLQSTMVLDDGLCEYFVQHRAWDHEEILDVEWVAFLMEEDAEQWLLQCVTYEANRTCSLLRSFLADDCTGYHRIFCMDDRAVIRAVALELVRWSYKVVIMPRLGWAVALDDGNGRPAIPVSVAPPADVDGLLDGMTLELANLVPAQGALDAVAAAAKSFPGFSPGLVKSLPTIGQAFTQPHYLAACPQEPLIPELNRMARSVTTDPMRVDQYKSMLLAMMADRDTMEGLQDFARHYQKAVPKAEQSRLGVSSTGDVVTLLMLALLAVHGGMAAHAAAVTPALAGAAERSQKLSAELKRVGERYRSYKRPAETQTSDSQTPARIKPIYDFLAGFLRKTAEAERTLALPMAYQLAGPELKTGGQTDPQVSHRDIAPGSYMFSLLKPVMEDRILK
jgi:hypothetical protein